MERRSFSCGKSVLIRLLGTNEMMLPPTSEEMRLLRVSIIRIGGFCIMKASMPEYAYELQVVL
jgi:hypothetical protein